MFCKSAVGLRPRLPIRRIAFGLYLAALDLLRLVYFIPIFCHFSQCLKVSFGLVYGLDPWFPVIRPPSLPRPMAACTAADV